MQAKRGMSPTQVLDRIGVLDGPTIAAHGVWLGDTDIAILKKHGTGVAHCPSSNMKLASGVAPVLKLLAAGVPTGVGTVLGGSGSTGGRKNRNRAIDSFKRTSFRSIRTAPGRLQSFPNSVLPLTLAVRREI